MSEAMELPLMEPAAVLATIRIAIATKSVHDIDQPVPGALIAAPRDEVPLLGLRVQLGHCIWVFLGLFLSFFLDRGREFSV